MGEYGAEPRTFHAPADAIDFATSAGTLAPVAPPRSRKLPNACKHCGKPAVRKFCSVACSNQAQREASAAV